MGKIQLELQVGAAGSAVGPRGWRQASGGCKGAAGGEEQQVEMLHLGRKTEGGGVWREGSPLRRWSLTEKPEE